MSSNVEPSKVTNTANNEIVSFSKRFPKDIEAIIFEIACSHERITPIHMSESIFAGQVNAGEQPPPLPFLCFRSSNPVPAVMHVNANAREISLHHYRLAFGVEDVVSQKLRDLDRFGLLQGRIYVNPTTDIICAEPGPRWSLFMRKMQDLKIEKIALNKSSFFSPFDSNFGGAVCPSNGSHSSGWVDEKNMKPTTLWTHTQPAELYYDVTFKPTSTTSNQHWKRSQWFYCCTAMEEANHFTKSLAVVQMLQQQENETTDNEGRDQQILKGCPKWLYNNLDTWERPKHKFLLHW